MDIKQPLHCFTIHSCVTEVIGFADECPDSWPGSGQHRPVCWSVHAAQGSQRGQYLGGGAGGRHPSHHGLDSSSRRLGTWRWGSGCSALLLAAAALLCAGVDVS